MSYSISKFSPSYFLKNRHVQTILPHLFRKPPTPDYTRERLTLPDGDFLDLDWVRNGSKKICILLHGLESSSNASYIKGLIHLLTIQKYDAVALNFRGCSGEINTQFKAYHSGETQDLLAVINHLTASYNYEEIKLIGFSLGGNATLKLAGEMGYDLPSIINQIITVSVPCHLESTSINLEKGFNRIYHNRFLKSLQQKLILKSEKFPDLLSKEAIQNLETLKDFDDYYTAPSSGFKNAKDYYTQSSSKQFIPEIKRKTLIINAIDDPFLTLESMPIKEAKANDFVTFLNPKNGGHVGFFSSLFSSVYWHEQQILDFLD